MEKAELKKLIKSILVVVGLYLILGKVGVFLYGAVKVWKYLKD